VTIDLGAPHGVTHYHVRTDKLTAIGLNAVLYAHGADGTSDQMATLALWKPMFEWLIDNGFVVVEGSGGSERGNQTWGNPAARAAYPAYLARAKQDLSISSVILFGRSMGVLVTAWLYANDTTGQYAGWINNSGVSTMFVGASPYDSVGTTQPAEIDRATAYYFNNNMWLSWGLSVANPDTLEGRKQGWDGMLTAAASAAPEQWPSSAWTGKKVLFCYGDADTTVPWGNRGGGPLVTQMGSAPALLRVSLTPGGGHGGTVNSYGDLAAMTSFISEVLGITPPAPARGDTFTADNPYWIDVDGSRYELELDTFSLTL
jgi:hypothetical protein